MEEHEPAGSNGPVASEIRTTRAADGALVSYIVYPGLDPPFLQIRTPGAPPLSLYTSPLLEPPEVAARFDRGRRSVRFDWRGSGASERIEGPLKIDDLVADLDAVTAAIGSPVDARVWGRACFAAFVHAARRPGRYRSLEINGGALRPSQSWQGFYNRPGWERDYSAHLQGVARHYFNVSDEEAVALALHWEREIPQESFAAYLEAIGDVDLSPVLPRIRIPAWVTARIPIDYGPAAEMAALLPNPILTITSPHERVAPLDSQGRDQWDLHLGSVLGDAPSAPIEDVNDGFQTHGADALTAREGEVLALIANADTNKEIAAVLGIAEGTVKRHVSNLLHKTGLENRRQLMRFADRRNEPN